MVVQIGPVPATNEQSQVKQNLAIQQLFGSVNTLLSSSVALTVGSTTIGGGTTLRVLYDNAGVIGEYTNIQLTALIAAFTTSLSGAAPASGGGTANYLRADGAWATPPTPAYTMANIAIVRVLAANDSLAVNAGLYLPEYFQ